MSHRADSKVVVDYKQGAKGVDLRPRLQLKDERGEVVEAAERHRCAVPPVA